MGKVSTGASDPVKKLKVQINEKARDLMQLLGLGSGDNSQYHCPNVKLGHRNGDRVPSTKLYDDEDGAHIHCHQCGFHGDAIKAGTTHLDLPESGAAFKTYTLIKLAKMLGLEIPKGFNSMSISERKYYEESNAAEVVTTILKRKTSQTAAINLLKESRGYTEEEATRIVKRFHVGCISEEALITQCAKSSITEDMLRKAGILPDDSRDKSPVFRTRNLILPIYSTYKQPLAFIARNTTWKKESNRPKYINTVNNRIFTKSKTLFGLSIAKPEIVKTKCVYVVEGQFDVISMNLAGIKNVVAISGSHIQTESIRELVRATSLNEVILALDSDHAGHSGVEKFIRAFYSQERTDVHISVKVLPEGEDPDSLVRSGGTKAFKDLKEESLLSHYVKTLFHGTKSREVEQKIMQFANSIADLNIPKIYRKTSAQDIFDCIKGVTERFSPMDIESFIEEAAQSERNPTVRKLKTIKSEMANLDISSPERALEVLNSATDQMTKLVHGATQSNVLTKQHMVLDGLMDPEKMQERVWLMTDALDQTIRPDTRGGLIIFGGESNIGKSQLFRHITAQYVRYYSGDLSRTKDHKIDPMILYFTLDDDKDTTIQWVAAALSKQSFDDVQDLHRMVKKGDHKEEVERIMRAYDDIKMNLGKNIMFMDVGDDSSFRSIDNIIRTVKSSDPDRHIIALIDNFHNIKELARAGGDKRTAAETLADEMKELSTTTRTTICATAELRKGNEGDRFKGRPHIGDLKETGAIAYRSVATIMLHNDVAYCHKSQKNRSIFQYLDEEHEDEGPKPILEFSIPKSKIGRFKGTKFALLDPYRSIIKYDPKINRLFEKIYYGAKARKDEINFLGKLSDKNKSFFERITGLNAQSGQPIEPEDVEEEDFEDMEDEKPRGGRRRPAQDEDDE